MRGGSYVTGWGLARVVGGGAFDADSTGVMPARWPTADHIKSLTVVS